VTPLLEIEGLRVRLPTAHGLVTVVDGIDLRVEQGEVAGVAGESGSGKTMTALALLRLLPPRAVVEGRATYMGRDLLALDRRGLRNVRGREIAMVFQDPMTSLHPMLTVERTLTEHLRHHFDLSKREARRRAIEQLEEVQLPDPEGSLSAFPHQFSGGMRQRIAIASALICGPKLLIADEPTTALDVTVQAGIIRLLDRLRRDNGLAVVLITHDLGVMSSVADSLSVMYAGRVVETGRTATLLDRPMHPYTRGLLGALPHPEAGEDARLESIPGTPANSADPPPGCAFHPRCPLAIDSCRVEVPPLISVEAARVACPVTPAIERVES
jgi:oligopeptide/dipeptide ABC transporter ATP-binding protein